MTLEQRVRRAERMLVMMVSSGRMTRSEWGFKINSLIHAQKANEVAAREQKERIDMLIQSQMETTEQIRSLAAGQAKTDQALRAFINSLRKGHNGSSSHG